MTRPYGDSYRLPDDCHAATLNPSGRSALLGAPRDFGWVKRGRQSPACELGRVPQVAHCLSTFSRVLTWSGLGWRVPSANAVANMAYAQNEISCVRLWQCEVWSEVEGRVGRDKGAGRSPVLCCGCVASLLGCAASRVFIHTVQRLCSCSCSAVWSCLRDAELSLHRRALSAASLVFGHFFPTEQLVDGIMRIIVTVLPLPLITPFAPNRMPRGHQLSRNAQHPERSIETRDV